MGTVHAPLLFRCGEWEGLLQTLPGKAVARHPTPTCHWQVFWLLWDCRPPPPTGAKG